MSHDDYLAYLDSPEWWAKRKRALLLANYRCERENPLGPRHIDQLNVHHRTYNHLGNERDEDLVVLCRACHAAEHAPKNRRLPELEKSGQTRLFDRWDAVPSYAQPLPKRAA